MEEANAVRGRCGTGMKRKYERVEGLEMDEERGVRWRRDGGGWRIEEAGRGRGEKSERERGGGARRAS